MSNPQTTLRNKIIGSAAISLLVPFIAWIGGYNFDQRCPQLAAITLLAMIVFVVAVTCPYWSNE